MAKRVSVKGRGADIFFGSGSPEQPAPPVAPSAPPVEVPVDAVANPLAPTSPTEFEPIASESLHARMQESVPARRKAGAAAREKEQLAPEQVLDSIWEYVSDRATVTNAFRYTDQELAWLTDALYEINKRHGVKLTKQDIARLGLNAVLWDYRTRGNLSLLATMAERRKQQRRGG